MEHDAKATEFRLTPNVRVGVWFILCFFDANLKIGHDAKTTEFWLMPSVRVGAWCIFLFHRCKLENTAQCENDRVPADAKRPCWRVVHFLFLPWCCLTRLAVHTSLSSVKNTASILHTDPSHFILCFTNPYLCVQVSMFFTI